MTYTLAMASDQHIQIAEDGVAEVAMTHARASLTELIRGVRWGKRPAAFTERGARVALVVPPDYYEEAEQARAFLRHLRESVAKLTPAQREALGNDLVSFMYPG